MSGEQFVLPLNDGLIIEEFSCAGGMGEAIKEATGRHVDDAVNHDEDACSLYLANHPQTRVHCADVYGKEVSPRAIAGDRPVDLLHMSPDCTDHSQAKGGQPRSKRRRGLAWIGVRWAGQKRPAIITMENVKQILKWGPLIAKRCSLTGRVVKLDGSVAGPGERVPVQLQYLIPDPAREGLYWRRFVEALRRMGYVVDWWLLKASNHGCGTKRERLFMSARCDGGQNVQAVADHFEKPARGQKRWIPAHASIDWSIASRSIFDREKPLVDATLRRIAHGLKRFVLGSEEPFIVADAADPAGFGRLSAQSLIQTGYGERRGQKPRVLDIDQPLGTIVGGGEKHGLVSAFLDEYVEGGAALPCATQDGALRCAAFLIQYYSSGGQWGDLADPMPTITTKDRLALVTVWFKGSRFVISDICLRTLVPRELATASSFRRDYILDRGHDGRRFSRAQQVGFIGNAVPPKMGAAHIRAQWGGRPSAIARPAANAHNIREAA